MKKITAFFISAIMIIELMPAVFADGSVTTFNLAKQQVINYMSEARELYATDDDYSETLAPAVYDSITASSECDIPNPVSLEWDAVSGAESYTLYISESSDFADDNTLVFENITATSKDVYHLYVNTQYYWKAVANNGISTDVNTFKTANTIRFIKVDGMRNVRDIGGWNGLNQGLVYRGTEMNPVTQNSDGSYFEITEEGKRVMLEELGIKTDIDLRASGNDQGNITASPLGNTVNWVNNGLGSYTSCLKEENMYKWKNVLSIFANSDNYPLYFHCYGGADRTGTVAFLVEALAGVSEVDLSIDFEATTFAHKVGYRRRNHPDDLVAVVNGLKEYGGNNINENVENYALYAGLTRSDISNIRSILAGNGITFKNTENVQTGNNVKITLKDIGNHTVKSVASQDVNITDYTLTGDVLNLKLPQAGIYTITLDDDSSLTFEAVPAVYPDISLVQTLDDAEPGRIECEALEATNSNDGVTGVVNKDGKRIGLGNSRYGQWSFDVDYEGIYNLKLIANTNYSDATVKLSVIDGDTVTDIGTVAVVGDGLHQDCITYPMTTVLPQVKLKEGKNTIRLTFYSSGTVSMDCINYALAEKNVTELTPGVYKAKADFTKLSENAKANLCFIAGVYNGTGLVEARIKNITEADENNVVTIENIEVANGESVKLFVWNKTSLIPIAENIEFGAAR